MQPQFYNAARHGAAVLRQPWSGGIIRLAGTDRVSWLQGMVSNDVEKLLPGNGTYAAHLNPQGRIVGQMKILVDRDALWLTMESSNVTKLGEVLERLIVMEDVQSESCTSSYESIGVLGPSAATVLEAWLGEPLNLEKEFQHREFLKCHRIVRDELGYSVWAGAGQAESVIAGIVAAGATLIDEATWNVVRIEAGVPLYGIDIDDTTTLPELGERGISYDKGCYIGQEVVARVKYIGRVNRRFVGFVCDGSEPLMPGSSVRSGGKDAGYVTSSVYSPQIGSAIALGFMNRAASVAGTRVELDSDKGTTSATISDLPFIPGTQPGG